MTDWTEQAPYLALFGAAMTEGQWAVFDLRGLRPYFAVSSNREAHPDLAELVFRFDALVVAPRFNPSTPMIPLPF